MADNLYQNHEGYSDPTAFAALYKTERGHKNMWKDGDIIKIESFSGIDKFAVLIRTYDGFAVSLPILDREIEGTTIQLNVKGIMYVDPRRIQFTTGRNLDIAELVRSLTDTEFDMIYSAVLRGLGADGKEVDVGSFRKENNALQKKCDALAKENAELSDRIKEFEGMFSIQNVAPEPDSNFEIQEIVRIKTERDIYKNLYDEIISKLTVGRAS